MKKSIRPAALLGILFFSLLIVVGSGFAQEADISVNSISFPSRMYLMKKAAVEIIIANNSEMDLKDCILSIEASDGSHAKEAIAMNKNTLQKIMLNWVPLKKGEIEFKVDIAPAQGITDSKKENNQISKKIDVLTQEK